MKIRNIIAASFAAVFALSSCVDKDPDWKVFENPAVDFVYSVAGDEYKYDYYVVSEIQFTNTSSATGAFTWDFGDGTTSNEVSPKHKYAQAGTYKVRLTHESKGSTEYHLMIYDITPILTVNSTSTEIVEFNNTLVDFALELPNPANLKVRYEWTFPEGTFTEAGEPLTTFTGYSDENGNISYPGKVKFSNIGSQRIDIRTYFDTEGENRRLDDAYLNVQVGVSEPAPTIYYAQRKGNIKAYKLVYDVPAGTKVLPYDLGVNAGETVFNLLSSSTSEVNDEGEVENTDWIYILDAGKQYYYINDTDGVLGDGKITAMKADGTGVNTVITNVGGAAFLDPFIGFIHNGQIYYTDRNTGCSVIPETTRGAVESQKSSTERSSYFFQNNLLAAYGRSISYGAISCGLYRDSNGWWWHGKKYNGCGIIRFRDTDIFTSSTEAGKAEEPAPSLLGGMAFTAMCVDEANKHLYIWLRNNAQGLYQYDLPSYTEKLDVTSKSTAYVAMEADPVNTTADEGLHTTQFALDKETGCVFFCYRPANGDTSGVSAGINYFDPKDNKVHKFGEGSDLGTGIVINPRKTKLF